MRTIKFRIWDHSAKKFKTIPQKLVGQRCSHICMSTEQESFCAFRLESTETRVYQQWTGMLDCKGREIYEGDILRSNKGTIVVSYFETFAAFGYWHEAPIGKVWHDFIGDFRAEYDTEVIGNIFETPELLNAAQP